MGEELEILKMVCRRLKERGVSYMITGSVAANFYAVPRMTRDIDIVVEVQKGDADRLLTIFKDDFYIDREAVLQAIDTQGMFNVIHNESVMKVDLIIRKDSSYRALEFERRRPLEIEGVTMWVVSPEDLILSKLFWAKESESEIQFMGDTSPRVISKMREMMQQKSAGERLKMGCSMYDFSRQLVTHSVLQRNPQLSQNALREEIFLRFYGNAFDRDQQQKIVKYLTSR